MSTPDEQVLTESVDDVDLAVADDHEERAGLAASGGPGARPGPAAWVPAWPGPDRLRGRHRDRGDPGRGHVRQPGGAALVFSGIISIAILGLVLDACLRGLLLLADPSRRR
jgi:hypothetical protein